MSGLRQARGGTATGRREVPPAGWWRASAVRKGLADLGFSMGAMALALAVSAGLIAASGLSVREAYTSLWEGAFGSVFGLATTLLNAIPLVLTGLAVAVGFQSGLFNIGAEGQLHVGALAAALTGLALGGGAAPAPGIAWGGVFLPFPLPALAGLATAALAGAAWAALPGILKARTGAHEVITTIMFNYVGILLTTFLVKAYFKEPGPVDQTPLLAPSARLPELIPYTRLSAALLLALAAVAGCDVLLRRTALGYELRLVGANAEAAAFAGVPVGRHLVLAMGFGGALAGLAGAAVVQGVLHRFITGFSPGYGFTGIAVAVLGRNRPWGVLLAALLFGALQAGGTAMQLFARIPADLMTVVQGLVILFVAAPALIPLLLGSRVAWPRWWGRIVAATGRPVSAATTTGKLAGRLATRSALAGGAAAAGGPAGGRGPAAGPEAGGVATGEMQSRGPEP